MPPPTAKPPPRPGSAPEAGPQDSSGRARNAGDELTDECAALEAEVEELKAKYEMYFLGVERREPVKWREDVKKKVLRVKSAFTRNTGLRFRIQTLHARYLAYERLWLRSAREREEGTYRRDLFKARLHGQGRDAVGGRPKAARPEAEDVDLSDSTDLGPAKPAPAAAAPATTPRAGPAAKPGAASAATPAVAKPAATPRPASAAAPSPGVDDKVRELHAAYVDAKRRCNEDVSRITPEAIARTIAKQTPEILKAHGAKSVDFKVVIKDGKAILKAVPRS